MLSHVRTLLIASLFIVASGRLMAASDQDLIVSSLNEKSPAGATLDTKEPLLGEQEFRINYDPTDFAGEFDESGTKAELLKALHEEMKSPKDEKVLYIPRAPTNEEQLKSLNNLTESEIQSFLGKKQKFLEKMAKALTSLHLKPKFVNKVLTEVNTKFYNSSRLIANSNSAGVSVMFSMSGGLALPRKIVEKLKERSLGKYIPKTGGFAYLVGFGFGVSRKTNAEGRPSWVFDVFVDTEKLKSTLTGMAEISAAGTYGVIYELREGKFGSQTTETSYGGVAGVFRQGTNQFGWAASTGMSFPPGIGAILVFTNQTTRHYILRMDSAKLTANPLEPILETAQAWLKATGLGSKKNAAALCSQVF